MCASNQRVLASDVVAIERNSLPLIRALFPGATIDPQDLDIANPCACALAQVSDQNYNTAVKELGLTNEQTLGLRIIATGSVEEQERRYTQLTNAWLVALYRNPSFVSQRALAA